MIYKDYKDLNKNLRGKNINIYIRISPYKYRVLGDVDNVVQSVMRLSGRTELRIGSEVDKFTSVYIEKSDHFYIYPKSLEIRIDFHKMEKEFEEKDNNIMQIEHELRGLE